MDLRSILPGLVIQPPAARNVVCLLTSTLTKARTGYTNIGMGLEVPLSTALYLSGLVWNYIAVVVRRVVVSEDSIACMWI